MLASSSAWKVWKAGLHGCMAYGWMACFMSHNRCFCLFSEACNTLWGFSLPNAAKFQQLMQHVLHRYAKVEEHC